jgi:ABC-type transport system involved in multi-copper enzyme maturation permease subunit
MSDNAPCTHRRKRRLGCQTKKCSDAPAAVKRFLTSGLFLTCRIDRLIPLAALALVTCIATILNPENGPLFMVAGDPNATVGGTIGFVGDVVVPGRVAESVLRASLVYTIVWIPAATIAGVTAVGIGTAETTAQLSQAKGVPGGTVGLARVIPQTIALSLAYFLSCTGAFILKTLTYGPPLTEAAWGTTLAITLTNCLLLCAIHTMSALIAAVCRMPLLALFLSLLLSIGPLLAYPRAYIAGSTPMVAWMNPTVWLMHTCSLNAPGALPAMSAAVGAGICVIASVLTYAICNCQEACR